jgi:hypothetical protein
MTDAITPPPELVQQWINEEDGLTAGHIATRAAQWGADTELEACCEVLARELICDGKHVATDLRTIRRPKPPSLKEQSLALIDLIQGNKKAWDISDLDVVRRALEQLND